MKLAGLAGVIALLAAQSGQDQDKVPVGGRMPALVFKTVLGGDGRQKLSEFRGQPVIVAWYSTVFAGLEAARLATDLEAEHAREGLVVFLMEIKNHDETYLRALQMAELPGVTSRLIKTGNLRVEYDDATGPPPRLVIVGVDGTLRYAGSYGKPSEVKKVVKDELKLVQSGWGTDELAKKARALAFGSGELGAARTMLGDSPQGEQKDAAEEIAARFAAWKRAIDHHFAEGEPSRADAAAKEIVRAAKGHPPWEEEAAKAAAAIENDEFARERELEVGLDKLLEPLKKGLRKSPKDIDAKLRDFATKNSGSKVGARASRLADAAAYARNELK